VTNAEVLGAAGPAKIGGVVQERADVENGGPPACPAGLEVKQRPDLVTPKAVMQQKPVESAPTVAPQPKPEPKKDDGGGDIEME
jgi:hypothetical protein